MKTLIAVVLACAGGVAYADDSVTLHFTAPKAGDKWTDDKSSSSSFDVNVNGTKAKVTEDASEKETVEVTKVKDGAVTEEKVSYSAFAQKQSMGGKDKPAAVDLTGKSYTVTAGTPNSVTAASGKASDAEIDLVRKSQRRVGKPDKMAKLFDGKSFTKDKKVELPAAELAEAMGDDSGMKAASMTMTYRGTSGGYANFDVTLDLEGDANGMHLVAKLAGTAKIDPKSSQLGILDVKGSVKGTGKATLDGTMTMHQASTK
jgi:hypothetical protein